MLNKLFFRNTVDPFIFAGTDFSWIEENHARFQSNHSKNSLHLMEKSKKSGTPKIYIYRKSSDFTVLTTKDKDALMLFSLRNSFSQGMKSSFSPVQVIYFLYHHMPVKTIQFPRLWTRLLYTRLNKCFLNILHWIKVLWHTKMDSGKKRGLSTLLCFVLNMYIILSSTVSFQ